MSPGWNLVSLGWDFVPQEGFDSSGWNLVSSRLGLMSPGWILVLQDGILFLWDGFQCSQAFLVTQLCQNFSHSWLWNSSWELWEFKPRNSQFPVQSRGGSSEDSTMLPGILSPEFWWERLNLLGREFPSSPVGASWIKFPTFWFGSPIGWETLPIGFHPWDGI